VFLRERADWWSNNKKKRPIGNVNSALEACVYDFKTILGEIGD